MRPRLLFVVAFSLPLLLASQSWLLSLSGEAGAYRPHSNPASAALSSNPLTALSMGGAILGALISGATVELQDLKVLVNEANLPPTFRLIAQRIGELGLELSDTLTRIDAALQETERVLDQELLEESKQQLGRTQALIRRGNGLVEELRAAADQLIRIVPVVPAALSDAFARFEQERERFRELWQRYQLRVAGLQERIAKVEEQGTPTVLLMGPTLPAVLVGQNLPVAGILIAGGEGLSGRRVELFFEDRSADSVITEDDGSFTSQTPVPLLYVPSARLEARYIPQEEDKGVFQGSSAATDVALIYFATSLQVESPATAYPGRSISLTADISVIGPASPARRLTVAVAGTPVTEAQCSRHCELTVPIPPDAPVGGALQLSTTVDPLGPYAGARQDVTFSITQIPVRMDLQAPLWTLVPGEVRLQGSVYAPSEPVEQGNVAIRFGELSDTIPVKDGAFSGRLDLPPSLIMGGPQQMEVTFRPKDPWLTQAALQRSVLLVNLWNLLLIAVLAMAGMVYVRTKTWSAIGRAPVPSAGMTVPGQQGQVSASPAGPWGMIVGEFGRAVHLIEQLLSVRPQPSTTLREFLALVERRLGKAFQAFQRLTKVTEEALYSPRTPNAAQAKEAEALAREVERTIKDA